MVIISVLIRDFRHSNMLQWIHKLELKMNRKLSLYQKILLTETGTVEQTLGILTDSQINVQIVKQVKTCKRIKRYIRIVNKQTGDKLLEASSTIFIDCLPNVVVKCIELKDQGIGNIITSFELETFRKITKIGYDSRTRSIFRTYYIIYNKNVAIKIREIF